MKHEDWHAYYRTLKELKAQAEAALQSGDTETASRLAQELLTQNTDRTTWNYGNEIHAGNQILGLAAFCSKAIPSRPKVIFSRRGRHPVLLN